MAIVIGPNGQISSSLLPNPSGSQQGASSANQTMYTPQNYNAGTGQAVPSSPQQYQTGGWYGGKQWNGSSFGAPGQVVVGGGSPSGGNTGSGGISQPNIDFDSIYNPLLSSLDQKESDLKNSIYPNELSAIDSQATQMGNNLSAQKADYETQYGQDQNRLDQNAGSAYAQAQNTYNQLVQRNLNMYGGRGVGQALNAVLGQGYQQSLGNTHAGYANALGDLLGKHSQFLTYYNTQKSNLDSQTAQDKKDAYAQYLQSYQDIQNNRSQIQSAKAQQIAGLQMQYQNQVNAIDTYRVQKAIDLQAWGQQFNQQLSAQMQSNAQNHANFLASNPFANSGLTQNIQQTGQPQSTAYFPLQNNNYQDPYSQLIG